MKQNKNYFSTTDLALATVISLYLPIEGIDKINPHKVEFLFKRTRELDQLIQVYWRKELKVEPQTFFAQLKVIKSRLYSTE